MLAADPQVVADLTADTFVAVITKNQIRGDSDD